MRLLSKIPIVRSGIEYIGKASLTILFLHPMFKCINYELPYISTWNSYALALINVVECLLVYRILSTSRYTKFLI